jgi:hypothetical protein
LKNENWKLGKRWQTPPSIRPISNFHFTIFNLRC